MTKDRIWVDRGAVGWKANSGGEEIFTVTIDLGREEQIAGFSWNTGAGLAEVTFPRSIEVEVSLDGKNWNPVGDLLAKSIQDRPLPPYGAYGTYRAYSLNMPCHGQLVRFSVKQSKYCFCDEIEIYRGGGLLSGED